MTISTNTLVEAAPKKAHTRHIPSESMLTTLRASFIRLLATRSIYFYKYNSSQFLLISSSLWELNLKKARALERGEQ